MVLSWLEFTKRVTIKEKMAWRLGQVLKISSGLGFAYVLSILKRFDIEFDLYYLDFWNIFKFIT
jgi:hypothetical protein